MKRLLLAVLVIGTVLCGWVAYAWAAGYLHVANATEYANVHAYKTFCSSSNSLCPTFPRGTGWYQRINNNEVRVEIYVNRLGSGRCYRVFDVRGYDGNMQISTAGSAPYWSCQ